ncbi:hypothetical protein [Campylobacter armoricus]|uniref:hypothetical protein n=1 Tax=Campylobacter armoricus TaxID=2505970 RepID=UPI001F1F2DAE|nr:hypothetical protein [Campylobacter armoricus]
MNEELQKEELPRKELNETEKELQILLKDAGVDEIGEKLLKEVEDANKTENFMHQNEVQAMKGITGFLDNVTDIGSKDYLLPFKIIIKRADNTLSGIDALIEYQKTKDGLKVSIKIGSEIIASQIFKIGIPIIRTAAITTYSAIAITSSTLLGVLAAISIVGTGMIILWWINSKIEDWLKDSGISFIDFIREYETHLSSEEKYYHNLAHCHQTQIKNMQRIQLYYNGKISKDLKNYYYPFYDVKKTPSLLNEKSLLKTISKDYKALKLKDTIDNIHINSEFYLLKALYFCESFASFNQNNQALFNEEKFPYHSSFYTIFLLHKDKITNTYLNARKELYKSVIEFNHSHNKTLLENLEKNDTKEDSKLLRFYNLSLSHFILENKDKNKRIIFFDNASSMSNLLHLYENNCDIFVKDESLIDIALLEQNYNLDFNKLKTRVFFYEKLLLGAKEDEIFSFNDEKINYYLKYDENNLYALKDLNITYDYYHCKIKNYVLAKNSLNIKLEPKKISKHYAYDDLNHQDLNLTHNNTSIINNTATSNYISLIIQDEHGRAIDNASISIKGYDHEKLIKQNVLRLKTNKEGKIRFDREKDFGNCYSFKVRLEDNKAYLAKPLQDSKRIFNNYINHKIGLILRFKNKDYFKYDGFYLYHFKGKDLIASYMARSGVAKADNLKPSNKQIAFSFYQDIKDKTTKKKAYFYYDDESIQDKFASLPEGKYYFKINEINYNKQPDFLKDYPFSIGKTWGKYCVRLYTDKECSKSFKEIEISNSNDEKGKSKNEESVSKGDLYLYNINEKGEFGSNGSIGIVNGVLFEDLLKHLSYVANEEELLCELEVKYPKKLNNKIVFASNNIDLNTSFAPGTYISLRLEEESDEKLKWAFVECESKEKLNLLLHDCNSYIDEKNLKVLFKNDDLIYNENYEDNVLSFCLPISRSNEPKEDMQDYKYYIVLFAYSSEKTIPNLEDYYIIIDMSFRVGVGDDDSVREGVLGKTNNIIHKNNLAKGIIYTNCIFNVFEAVDFLKTCQNFKEEINETNNDTFFKTYPQLAGKIAYIYYRFDLTKIYFQVKSMKNMQIKHKNHFQDIIYYENTIKKTIQKHNYDPNKNYPIAYWKKLVEEICSQFKLNIKTEFISSNDSNLFGFYNQDEAIIKINTNNIEHTEEILKTIIHEIRHAYIHQKKLNNDVLQYYIYYSNQYIYFNKADQNFGNKTIPDVYFFQPSEAEARAIEESIIKELK